MGFGRVEKKKKGSGNRKQDNIKKKSRWRE
jgi:hypothetical protein